MNIGGGVHTFQNVVRFRAGRLSRRRNERHGFHRRGFSGTELLRLFGIAILCFTCVTNATAQALTDKQRIADLNQLAALFAKNYAPYEWKRDAVGFDLMRMTPWLQRISQSNDLNFQETLIDYIASLNDAHCSITFPSNFSAFLGMSVDIYDGQVLIDGIDRTLLPFAQFPLS